MLYGLYRKTTTKKELEKALEAETKRRTNLSKKLKEARADNKHLRETMSQIDDDADDMPRHSTMHEGYSGNQSNSFLMTSMNTLSVASLNIAECKPSENEDEIDRKSFEAWKDKLEASMDLIGVSDEMTKMNVLKVKAGLKLLDVLEGTPPQASPDVITAPYSNAMKRLKDFFGSREYCLMQRQKLRSMVQTPGEADSKYVKRVIAAAKLCDFDEDKIAESVADVIQWHALNIKVREAGRKILRKGGSLTELVDKIRGYEVAQTNEDIFARTHPQASGANVAAVVRGQSGVDYHQRSVMRGQPGVDYHQRSNNQSGSPRGFRGRFNGYPGRSGNWQGRGSSEFRRREESSEFRRREESKPPNLPCTRCTGRFHKPENCHAIDRICHNCKQVGHIARACPEMAVPVSFKRRISEEGESSTKHKKIAAVSKEDDDVENDVVSG